MKRLIVGVSVALVLTSLPTYSATPPKAGATCSKLGSSTTYQGKKFTCIKSGKKLIWNKGIAVKSSSSQPSPSPSQTVNSSPLSVCEIKEDNVYRKTNGILMSGFPHQQTYLPKIGTINVALIPIDWADLPGESDWEKRVQSQMTIFDDYWKTEIGRAHV